MKEIELKSQEGLYYHWPLDNMLRPCPPKFGEKTQIRLYTLAPDIISVCLRMAPDGEEQLLGMRESKKGEFASMDGPLRIWTSSFILMDPNLHYRFRIEFKSQYIWLNGQGLWDIVPLDDLDFSVPAHKKPPEWIKKAIFYQIFPDRFCQSQRKQKNAGSPENNNDFNGKNSNFSKNSVDFNNDFSKGAGDYSNGDHENLRERDYEYFGGRPQNRDWDQSPLPWAKGKCLDFFNGDLPGITEKLDYLKDLGINGIWLNPIFESLSNHRYDTTDFSKIDPYLGGEKAYFKLLEKAHKKGIRIVLDGVFNHVGVDHPWFNKTKRHGEDGAYQDPKSPFIDFFTFNEYPRNYHSWLGIDSLPKLNYLSEKLKDAIYRDDESPVRKWLKPPNNMDGWRLDVANMLGKDGKTQIHHQILGELARNAKESNKDAYIFGEHFFDGSDAVGPDLLDGIMNYLGFNHPVREWITGIDKNYKKIIPSAEKLLRSLLQVRSKLPVLWQLCLFNQLSSHDMPRLSSYLAPESLEKLHICAAALLFGYIGVPCIYYGDELGLFGGADPFNRETMPWDEKLQEKSLYKAYKNLTLVRQSPALYKGGMVPLYAQGDTLIFARIYGEQCFIIGINRGKKPFSKKIDFFKAMIFEETGFIDILSREKYQLDSSKKLNLSGQSCVFLEKITK